MKFAVAETMLFYRYSTTKQVMPFLMTNFTESSQSPNLILFGSFILAEDIQLSANAVLLCEARQLSTEQQSLHDMATAIL